MEYQTNLPKIVEETGRWSIFAATSIAAKIEKLVAACKLTPTLHPSGNMAPWLDLESIGVGHHIEGTAPFQGELANSTVLDELGLFVSFFRRSE